MKRTPFIKIVRGERIYFPQKATKKIHTYNSCQLKWDNAWGTTSKIKINLTWVNYNLIRCRVTQLYVAFILATNWWKKNTCIVLSQCNTLKRTYKRLYFVSKILIFTRFLSSGYTILLFYKFEKLRCSSNGKISRVG